MMDKLDTSKNKNLCIATVTTDSYIVGTLVTLYSFLKFNPWFDGEIVLISDNLSSENRNLINLLYNKIIFFDVNQKLISKVESFINDLPQFSRKRARFFSLELFRLKKYKKVFFLDGDLLFCHSVKEIFNLPNKFIASGDAGHYNGLGRNWGSKLYKDSIKRKSETLYNTFNSGMLLVDNSYINNETYKELLKLIDSRIFKEYEIKQTDQAILNIYFSGQQHIISGVYNFLLVNKHLIYKYEKISVQDAYVLHFNGQYKPWFANKVLERSLKNLDYLKAYGLWSEMYFELLQTLHLKYKTKDFFN